MLKGEKTLQLSLSLRDDNIQPDSEVTKHSVVAWQRGTVRERRSSGPHHSSGNGYFVCPVPEPGGSPGYHNAWLLKSHRMNNFCLRAEEKIFPPGQFQTEWELRIQSLCNFQITFRYICPLLTGYFQRSVLLFSSFFHQQQLLYSWFRAS